jgi:hypothetical protein
MASRLFSDHGYRVTTIYFGKRRAHPVFFAKNVLLGIFSIHSIPKNTPFGAIAISTFASQNDNIMAGFFTHF